MRTSLSLLFVGLLISFTSGCMSVGGGKEFDAGIFASRDVDLSGTARFRALGPFFEKQKAENGDAFRAVRPFYSHIDQPENQKHLTEILWPIGMFKDFREDRYWRFFPAWGRDFNNIEDDSRWRFNIFPVLFSGQDKSGEHYFAIFPLGGEIHEFLGRDELIFVLWPLFAHSSVRGIVTKDILWPFVSWTKGEGVDRVRIFPFYGKSVNEGRSEKKFIMWPIWTQAMYDFPNEKGFGFILFPIYGHAVSGDKESWMVLPPFFRYSVSDTQTEAYLPYPLIQYASGDVNKFYLWPLWGWKDNRGVDSWFFLWPIIKKRTIDRGEQEARQLTVLPLIINDSVVNKDDGDVTSRYFKFWPFMSYRREADATRFRMLDLWVARESNSIERNLSPIWTLFSRERVGDATETELLWGLFRKRKNKDGGKRCSVFPLYSSRKSGDGENSKWSVLFGLLGREREGLQKKYKLLYFFEI